MSTISLVLKHEEALVFFEWLTLTEERTDPGLWDEAEQKVLWKIEGELERQLPDVLMEDYKQRVLEAKRRV